MTQIVEPTLLSFLQSRFDHDLWANLIWIDLLSHFTNPLANEKIQNILQKQEELLKVCSGNARVNNSDLKERARENCISWKSYVDQVDLMQEATIVSQFEQENGSYSIFEIANNVCLHGTYNRGALALLAKQEAWPKEMIPCTGPLRFLRERTR